MNVLNSDLNGRLIRGSDFTGLNAPAQSDGSYYRVQLLSSGQFRIAKNIGGSFDSWNDFLTNADLELLSGAQRIQADYTNQTAYYKVINNNVIHQLAFNASGIHYDKLENGNWTNVWHMYKN